MPCFGEPVEGQEEDIRRPEMDRIFSDNEDTTEKTSAHPATKQTVPGLYRQGECPFYFSCHTDVRHVQSPNLIRHQHADAGNFTQESRGARLCIMSMNE